VRDSIDAFSPVPNHLLLFPNTHVGDANRPEGFWTDPENIKSELQVFFTVREGACVWVLCVVYVPINLYESINQSIDRAIDVTLIM
jgi:hypothetical protein